jgi:D-3-phosphoglycerate dehydrogenase / 2-oxoglutarate reductase
MSAFLVAVADSPFPSLDPVEQVLRPLGARLSLAASGAAPDILAVARDADALLVCYAKLPGDLIRQLTRCKVIARTGLGVDNIDLAAARERKIAVTYVPDYCMDEVSDHAMALLLALARKVAHANSLVQGGRWEMAAVAPMHRLRGRTLGLVGFGNIPRALAPKAKAFGLRVLAYDPFVAQDVFSSAAVEGVGLGELLASSDFISVHAPLTPQTRGLIDASALAKAKPGALIINTARGPLIDEKALIAALDSGRIGGAALDVLETEPPPNDFALIGRPNVILTPHTAFYSVEALEELQAKSATDVARVLSGQPPLYPAPGGM